jgi:3-hydroxyacyl-CoA dehydrogenase
MSTIKIKKVAVLGSGVMGSRIACHFANIGLDVLLLDIKANENNHPNKIVNDALAAAVKSNPSPIYSKKFVSRIKTGNFDDHLQEIKNCDWIIEAIIERLDIKKSLYEKVELYRTKGTLISTNTSGIPIELLIEGRSEDFQDYFCGTHFFNPPRYLKLFEIIPSSKTNRKVIDFFLEYAPLYLGKVAVLCKDTPAFIANRIGVFSMMSVFHLMQEMDLSIDDVDALTGTLLGKPKSASFRTADVVGLDTLVKVAEGIRNFCPNDEQKHTFEMPAFVDFLTKNNFLGDKTGQGFYKKTKNDSGKTEILSLNTKTLEYQKVEKTRFASVGAVKSEENLKKRIQLMHLQKDVAAQFIKKLNYKIFEYVTHRIPEISNDLYAIDDAMRAGFGWEFGPFETWDILGVSACYEEMIAMGFKPAAWVKTLIDSGNNHFYTLVNGQRQFYNISKQDFDFVPGTSNNIKLDHIRKEKTVWKNSGCQLIDLGDGIINVEFNTKMNAIGAEIIQGIHKAIDLAEAGEFRGVVLGNDAANFSAGANLAMVYMLALEQEFDELNMVIKMFQDTVMRLRYSSIPVVGAPHGLTLGGGCEMMMHCDAVVAAAETYIGLVEVGVGLIPGGGGTKELALRVSDACTDSDPILPKLADAFTAIATAKTATSAYEGFEIGVLLPNKDEVCIQRERIILEAKNKAIMLSENGYVKPIQRADIRVMGRSGLGALYAGIEGFVLGNYASEHDKKIAQKVAWILCGGDLSMPTLVTEQYLLDLEREAFLSLLGERKTLERIQSILTSGKPLRN